MAESGLSSGEKVSAGANFNGNNGLLLYSYHHCFYTQKVLMALYEKKIPFTTKLVDITKKEQYQSWYLKINPRGEVPVLKDGIKYIPDSERIIQYLEDNFSNGEHSRLIPIDRGPEIRQKVIKFHTEIESIPANEITLGSLYHKEFCSNLRYPFVLPSVQKLLRGMLYHVQKQTFQITASEKSSGENLRKLAVNIPEYQEILLDKADVHDKRSALIANRNEFIKVLKKVEDLLDKIEDELSEDDKKQSDWWLCLDHFTIADISLTVLLDRLSRVGLEAYFWGKGKRPNVDKYYQRVQRRDSYKKAIPSLMTDLSIMLRNRAPLIIGFGLLTVLTVVVGGFIYFKK